MRPSEVWDLIQFLNKRKIFKKNSEIAFFSKKCSAYELTVACMDTRVWRMGIDPMPYSSETISGWVSEGDIQDHEVSKFDDWSLEPESVKELSDMILGAQRKFNRECFGHIVNITRSEGVYTPSYDDEID